MRDAGDVSLVTFSVIPALTAVWVRLALRAFPGPGTRILVGDCSGGLRRLSDPEGRLCVVRFRNSPHGVKLDRALRSLCRSERVIVCDDDVFWLSGRPWSWSAEVLAHSPRIAAISLAPRDPISAAALERLPPGLLPPGTRPMGAFCLLVRRSLWRRENLSFRAVPAAARADGVAFDTADFAHLELLRRGWEVVMAPPVVCRQLAVFERTSSWLLAVRRTGGDVRRLVGERGSRQEKALRAIRLARCVDRQVREQLSDLDLPAPAPGPSLDRAEEICASFLGPTRADRIRRQVRSAFAPVIRCLREKREP